MLKGSKLPRPRKIPDPPRGVVTPMLNSCLSDLEGVLQWLPENSKQRESVQSNYQMMQTIMEKHEIRRREREIEEQLAAVSSIGSPGGRRKSLSTMTVSRSIPTLPGPA